MDAEFVKYFSSQTRSGKLMKTYSSGVDCAIEAQSRTATKQRVENKQVKGVTVCLLTSATGEKFKTLTIDKAAMSQSFKGSPPIDVCSK
jgi:hypothetical protein